MSMTNVLGDPNDFLSSLDSGILASNQKDKERAERTRFGNLFRMPEVAEPDGTRRTVIRFITPWGSGIKLKCHESYGKVRTVCPLVYGKQCQYCKMSEDALRKAGVDTKDYFGWQVWNYQGGRDGTGQAQLFMYAVNKASPIPAVAAVLSEEKKAAVDEGRKPLTMNDFDVILIQHGEAAKRTFNAMPRAPRPFKQLVEPWSHQFMQETWTYVMSKESRALLDLQDEQGEQAAVLRPEADDLSNLLDQD